MKQPFRASPVELSEHVEGYVDAVYASLESQLLVLPRVATSSNTRASRRPTRR